MKIERLPIERIELNTGQIEGLPANPRQWTRDDIDSIAKSLKETPELFEMRPCIVYPQGDKFILLAGNLRFTGARQNGDKDVPCIVCPKTMPIDKVKEIVIKDNGSFGAWDFDALANEWNDIPLTDWGVPAWEMPSDEEPKQPKDISDQIQNEFKIEVNCVNEAEQEQLYNKLIGEGYECRILTL